MLEARNPKAEAMARLIVENINKAEKIIGKNPNMDIKTYNIGYKVIHDRTEHNYNAYEISENTYLYRQQIETEYCNVFKLVKDKYDVEFVFNVYGNNNKKAFTHILNCN